MSIKDVVSLQYGKLYLDRTKQWSIAESERTYEMLNRGRKRIHRVIVRMVRQKNWRKLLP